MRVYVPLTLPGLAQARRKGEVGSGPFAACAVTPGLREWYVSDDMEELEYAALTRAARASLRLLAADPGAVRRRVVLAVEVPDAAVTAGPEGAAIGEVRVLGPVPMARAAAVHIDGPEAEADVTAAVDALTGADQGGGGPEGAHPAVDGAEDHELLWYGVQEIPALVTELAGGLPE